VDLAPERATPGGYLVAQGKPQQIADSAESLTGRYLSGELKIPVPDTRRSANGKSIQVLGATANNLKDVDVTIPLACSPSSPAFPGPGNPRSSTTFSIARRAKALSLERNPSAHIVKSPASNS